MQLRPIKILVDALKQLGADISYENNNIYSYPILFNLENTNNISLNFN